MKKVVPMLMLVSLLFSCATANSGALGEGGESAEPLPYGEDEFSPALVKLRRAEILFLGSLPLFYMFSSVGYDLAVTSPPDGQTALFQKLGLSLSLSGVLALADFIIGEVEPKPDQRTQNYD